MRVKKPGFLKVFERAEERDNRPLLDLLDGPNSLHTPPGTDVYSPPPSILPTNGNSGGGVKTASPPLEQAPNNHPRPETMKEATTSRSSSSEPINDLPTHAPENVSNSRTSPASSGPSSSSTRGIFDTPPTPTSKPRRSESTRRGFFGTKKKQKAQEAVADDSSSSSSSSSDDDDVNYEAAVMNVSADDDANTFVQFTLEVTKKDEQKKPMGTFHAGENDDQAGKEGNKRPDLLESVNKRNNNHRQQQESSSPPIDVPITTWQRSSPRQSSRKHKGRESSTNHKTSEGNNNQREQQPPAAVTPTTTTLSRSAPTRQASRRQKSNASDGPTTGHPQTSRRQKSNASDGPTTSHLQTSRSQRNDASDGPTAHPQTPRRQKSDASDGPTHHQRASRRQESDASNESSIKQQTPRRQKSDASEPFNHHDGDEGGKNNASLGHKLVSDEKKQPRMDQNARSNSRRSLVDLLDKDKPTVDQEVRKILNIKEDVGDDIKTGWPAQQPILGTRKSSYRHLRRDGSGDLEMKPSNRTLLKKSASERFAGSTHGGSAKGSEHSTGESSTELGQALKAKPRGTHAQTQKKDRPGIHKSRSMFGVVDKVQNFNQLLQGVHPQEVQDDLTLTQRISSILGASPDRNGGSVSSVTPRKPHDRHQHHHENETKKSRQGFTDSPNRTSSHSRGNPRERERREGAPDSPMKKSSHSREKPERGYEAADSPNKSSAHGRENPKANEQSQQVATPIILLREAQKKVDHPSPKRDQNESASYLVARDSLTPPSSKKNAVQGNMQNSPRKDSGNGIQEFLAPKTSPTPPEKTPSHSSSRKYVNPDDASASGSKSEGASQSIREDTTTSLPTAPALSPRLRPRSPRGQSSRRHRRQLSPRSLKPKEDVVFSWTRSGASSECPSNSPPRTDSRQRGASASTNAIFDTQRTRANDEVEKQKNPEDETLVEITERDMEETQKIVESQKSGKSEESDTPSVFVSSVLTGSKHSELISRQDKATETNDLGSNQVLPKEQKSSSQHGATMLLRGSIKGQDVRNVLQTQLDSAMARLEDARKLVSKLEDEVNQLTEKLNNI